ncbi:MAG: hypothetical protein DME04_22225 [Candidatus Rokuibacteriota bacterium]|nr:MAG: hypothetical protein DME04_22225 [Candidatus Rokubacteria bacterium]
MKLTIVLASVALALAALSSGPAVAGPYSDELAKCLVRSTTDADKNYLVKWLFASAALHPEVRSIASVSDAERTDLNRNAAKLFERLITESCSTQTQEALKYEGPNTLQSSFEVLGQVAGRRLFSDPAVAKSMAEFANYLDKQKFDRIFGPAR